MMKKLFWMLAITSGCLLALSAPTQAQKGKEKPPETTKEELQQERMQKLMTAYDLAEQGRKKNAPEYLITAAGLLRQLSSIKDLQDIKNLDAKVEITGAKKTDVVDMEIPTPSLAQQSTDLFKEASDMGATLGVNVDKLIKLAKDRAAEEESKLPEEQRAVVGGPKRIHRHIGPGQAHSLTVTIKGKKQTCFGYQGRFPMHLSVVHDGIDSVWLNGMTMQAQRVWMPGGDCRLVIRVQNPTKLKSEYQLFIN